MPEEKYIPRLKEKYLKEVVPYMTKKFNYNNILKVPKIKAIVLNMGVGEARDDKKFLDEACECLSIISGQKPAITKAKKSIAGFKLRKGKPIGCKVTLRRNYMYEFLDRFITFTLPRIRDFRGLKPDSFDRKGNYSLGVEEQQVFPEMANEQVSNVLGIDICFVTTAKTNEEGYELLKAFGIPFRKQ
jgi:large subunit ribosomal protein L5